ncbi:hypothetical protein [Brucella pituitosa]
MSGTDTPEVTGTESMGVSQGADAIAKLMFPPEQDTETEQATPAAETEAEVTEEAATEEEVEAEVSDDDTDQSEEETQEEEPAEEPRIRLADGTEVTLSEIEDLRKGNLRQSDYTRKTQEIAATRKELESRQAEISQQAQFFQQNIEFAIDVAKAHLPQMPDPNLAYTDPFAYVQQKAAYEEKAGELQQLIQAKQRHQEQISNSQRQSQFEMARNEAEALATAMPELKDPAKLQSFHADLVKGVQHYGIQADEVGQVMDHRLFLMARDAMAYRKLMAQKPKALEKAKDVPPVQKPGNRASPQQQAARATQDKMSTLRRTGSMKDGANVILDILGE